MSARPVQKMMYVGERNPALSPEAFPARWKQHAVMASTVASVADEVLGMAQCSRVLDNDVLPGAATRYDGVSIMCVTDPRLIVASQTSPQHVELLLPDELEVFTDYVANSTVTGHEVLVHSRPIERAKNKFVVIDIRRCRAGVSPQAFDAHLRSHSELVKSLPRFHDDVLRYADNAIYGPRPAGHEHDAITEMWFDSLDSVASFLTPATRRAIDADLSSFVDLDHRTTLLTRVSHAFYRPGQLAAVQLPSV